MQLRWAWVEANLSKMQASLSPMKPRELVRRLRAYQTFPSQMCFEHPPPPSVPLGTDTADLPYNRCQVTSQFPDVLQSWNPEIDRLGHPLAEIGNDDVGFCTQRLDKRRPGKAAGTTGPVEQGKDPVFAGDVGHGGAQRMGIAKSRHLGFEQHHHVTGKRDHRIDRRRERDGYIDNDVVEPLTEQTQHMSYARFRDFELRIEVLVGRDQANPLVNFDC